MARGKALIKATVIGQANTIDALIECSMDLPPDAIGEVVVDVMQKAWKAGEDPTKCVCVLTFA